MTIRIVNLKGSVTANSNVLVLIEPSEVIKIGDSIIHGSLTTPIYVKEIKSNVRIIGSNVFATSIVSGTFGFGRDEETSKFNKFINAYYNFLESSGNSQEVLQNIRSYSDIDKTVDSLLSNFFINYASNIPQTLVADKRTFVKRVKDLYKTNGTEDAHKILFRALFDEDIEIVYPEDQVLKASDGEWVKDYVMNVSEGSGYNPFFLENTKIVGDTSGATATVSGVIKLTSNNKTYYQLNIDGGSIDGNFILDESITARKLVTLSNVITVNAKIIPSIIGIDVLNKGFGYTNNNIITLNSLTGDSARIKLKTFDKFGGLRFIEIVDNGIYYFSNTIVTINAPKMRVQGNLTITSSTPNNIATFASVVPHGLNTKSTANVQINTTNILASIYTVINAQEFRFRTTFAPGVYTANLIYDNSANLRANVGAIKESDGYWKSSKGKLSELIFLRGSKSDLYQYPIYYQPYSYVVRTNVPNNEWEDIVRKTVHPAGTELFGEVFLTTEGNVSVDSSSVETEIWSYIGLTSDKDTIKSDATVFGSNTIVGFSITADHSFVLFNYL